MNADVYHGLLLFGSAVMLSFFFLLYGEQEPSDDGEVAGIFALLLGAFTGAIGVPPVSALPLAGIAFALLIVSVLLAFPGQVS